MAKPAERDWLEPPLWWKKWRPLRWLAAVLLLVGLYRGLSPWFEDAGAPAPAVSRAAPAAAQTPLTEPSATPQAEPAPVAPPAAAAASVPPRSAATPAPQSARAAPELPADAATLVTPPPAQAAVQAPAERLPTPQPPVEEAAAPVAAAPAGSVMAAFTRVEPDPVALLGNYRSYASVDDVVYDLERAGFLPVVESRHAAVPKDTPPRELDIVVVHQFRHWGIQGRLELQFFNNRLYQTEFEPEEPEYYRAAQRRELPQLKPERAGRSEWVSGHLRVASSLDLAVSEVGRALRTRPFLLWQDRRLVHQRDEWDRRFAPAVR